MSSSSRADDASHMHLSAAEKKERAREKARLRKQRYNERMRSAAAAEGSGPKRGVVLHLSEAARNVLRENRQRRRLAGLPAVLDSQLVETLLLRHAAQPPAEHPAAVLVVDETKASPEIAHLVAVAQQLENRLKASQLAFFAAEGEIEDLEEQVKAAEDETAEAESGEHPVDWDKVEHLLLAIHRLLGRNWSVSMTEQVFAKGRKAASPARAAGEVQQAVGHYISELVYEIRMSHWG